MGAYHYQALTKTGSYNKGIIEAESERHARQLLRDRDLIPVEMRAVLAKQQLRVNKQKLNSQDLTLVTRQLATLLAAGIPLEEALRGVSEQTEKNKVRELILGVHAKVLEGYALAKAMAEFPHAFSELYCATVHAGEQTGRLDIILEKLASYTEKQQEAKQKIQQALIYPALMIFISTAILCFLLAFVVPKIIDVFNSSQQSLPNMTKCLIAISGFIKVYGLSIFLILFVSLIIFKRSLTNTQLRMRWHQFLLKLPMIAYLVKSTNVARYIHTFSILFAAGVNVLETMRVSASLVTNLKMRQSFEQAAIRVKEGSAIHQALKEKSYLSPMSIHLVASGEKSGQLAAMMERAANYMDHEIKRLIDTALTLLEPMIILMMGGIVLFIVLATLLPIFSMEQLVGS